MPSINDQIADLTLETTVRVNQFGKTVNAQVQGNLELLSREIAREIAKADMDAATPRGQKARLERLQKDVDKAIERTYSANAVDTQRGLTEIGKFTATAWPKGANQIFSANIIDVTLTGRELAVLTRDPVVLGHRTSEHWKKQSANLRHKFVGEMRNGITAGETNDELVDRIIGKKTKQKKTVVIDDKPRKVPVRKGGIMQIAENDARTLVRTSVQTVSNTVLHETYLENDDVIKGEAVLVTLDGRTTHICKSLSGASWSLEGVPLPESPKKIPYPGPPPYHMNCRTVMSPVTKSFEELGARSKAKKDLEVAPKSVRASMDGHVPGDLTYEQWLTGKPAKFQTEVLGPGRRKLWQDGKISLDQLTDSTLKVRTLEELRALT
jgi:hypothetical protein